MKNFESRLNLASAVALVCFSMTVGCAEPTIDEEDAVDYVDDWSSSVESHLESRAVLAAGSEALQSRLEDAKAEERRAQPAVPFTELVAQVYEQRDYEPVLVGDEGLTDAGEAVWEVLKQVQDHNLDPEPYRQDAIAEGLETWQKRRQSVDGYDALAATDDDRDEAVAWLVEQPESEFALSDENFDRLTDALVDADDKGQRLRGAVEEYQDKQASIAEAAARAEVLLARGLARYAWEQRHFRIKDIFVHPRHWDFYNEPDVEDSGRRPDPARGGFLAGRIWRDAAHLTEEIAEENEVELLDEKIRQTVASIFDSDEPARLVGAIAPQQPQYAGLVDEHRRYREIVEDGGWEEVPRNRNLSPGQRSEVVEKLKKRLQIEGYLPDDADIDDHYDEALTEAIRAYQQTHQLRVTGRPHHVFWYSLNIPAERRLAQIRLNLDRWRKTNIDHDLDTYAFVNVPDFTVEVWHEQERIRRHRTIVGDNEKSMNPLTDEEEYSNRTPTPMAAYIDRIIFNPYWNVTERIRAVRILPDVRESIEEKYALKFRELQRRVEHEEEPNVEELTLVSIRDEFELSEDDVPVDEEAEDAGGGEEEAEGGDRQQELAALSAPVGAEAGVDADAEQELEEKEEEKTSALDRLSDEERQELKEERFAEKTAQTLAQWTTIREVYNEEQERDEKKRFFELAELHQLEATLVGDDEEAREEFRDRFPYLDWETGEVDVESTDPDNIPSWYEENGYEVAHPGHDTWEYVRMLPGESNALGDVKIIFPNYDNIYLHDTPERGLFDSNVRGFSHGCIRVQEPLQLSQTLLELGGREDEAPRIDRILDDEEYYPIFLERQIPVFLEYYTVSIDDEGRANFLADIYDYDEKALDG